VAYFFGGKRLEPGKPFSAGDTMFPENYLDLSTPEEKKALGITEQEDPEPIRMAGEGPTSSVEETSPTKTADTTSFPETDIDDSTKQFLDSLGQDFFDQYVKPQYAGDKFNVQEGRLRYNKPEHQKGGVIRYARPDKITPPPTEFLPTTGETPAKPTTPTTPTTPTFTPPPGTSPSITYPSAPDFKAETPSSGGDDGGGDDGGRNNPPLTKPPLTESPGKGPEETFKVPDPTPTSDTTPTPDATPAPKATPQIMAMERFYKPGGGHLQTSNPSVENLEGFTREGPSFNLYKDENLPEASDVYRIFNPSTGNHLLTTNKAEVDAAVAGGYQAEGVTGEAYTSQREGTEAVERYYNAVTGQHLLTRDPNEMATLAELGYGYEGTAFYAPK